MGIYKRMALCLGIAIGILISAESFATPPPIKANDTFEGDFGAFIECDDYDVWYHWIEYDAITIWTNDVGDPVREQFMVRKLEADFYNFDHPEISISQSSAGNGHLMLDFDLETGDLHVAGSDVALTLPGVGRIVWDLGTTFYDASTDTWVSHGRTFYAEGDAGAALCEALAYPQ